MLQIVNLCAAVLFKQAFPAVPTLLLQFFVSSLEFFRHSEKFESNNE